MYNIYVFIIFIIIKIVFKPEIVSFRIVAYAFNFVHVYLIT